MNEEIKEMLHCIEMNCKHNKCFGGIKLDEKDCKLLLDYITNLQQDLDKTIDTIEKDRQFYKCRMDEYAELKKENERLKEEKQRLLYNLEKVCDGEDYYILYNSDEVLNGVDENE